MEERIDCVTQPVLIVRAPEDPFASPHAQELARHLRHAASVRIADIEGGMVPLPDQLPEAFARCVSDFLAR